MRRRALVETDGAGLLRFGAAAEVQNFHVLLDRLDAKILKNNSVAK